MPDEAAETVSDAGSDTTAGTDSDGLEDMVGKKEGEREGKVVRWGGWGKVGEC